MEFEKDQFEEDDELSRLDDDEELGSEGDATIEEEEILLVEDEPAEEGEEEPAAKPAPKAAPKAAPKPAAKKPAAKKVAKKKPAAKKPAKKAKRPSQRRPPKNLRRKSAVRRFAGPSKRTRRGPLRGEWAFVFLDGPKRIGAG